jgi:hypothetical protein
MYGCFVAVTGVLWLSHTIYLRTSIPRQRRLRRVEGTFNLSICDAMLTLYAVLASKLYPDHTRFEIMTKRFLRIVPYSWRAINATSAWRAMMAAYDTSGTLHDLEQSFVCDMTADKALQKLERRLQDILSARTLEVPAQWTQWSLKDTSRGSVVVVIYYLPNASADQKFPSTTIKVMASTFLARIWHYFTPTIFSTIALQRVLQF